MVQDLIFIRYLIIIQIVSSGFSDDDCEKLVAFICMSNSINIILRSIVRRYKMEINQFIIITLLISYKRRVSQFFFDDWMFFRWRILDHLSHSRAVRSPWLFFQQRLSRSSRPHGRLSNTAVVFVNRGNILIYHSSLTLLP